MGVLTQPSIALRPHVPIGMQMSQALACGARFVKVFFMLELGLAKLGLVELELGLTTVSPSLILSLKLDEVEIIRDLLLVWFYQMGVSHSFDFLQDYNTHTS